MGFFLFLFFLFLIMFFITKYVSSKEIPPSSSTSTSTSTSTSASVSASASALSAINIPQRKYDVFLSFRGEDTRHTFTGHLHEALHRNRIKAFIDNQLKRGDEISQSLLKAIEESTVSIIIFSERYASSGWCLDELVKILECKNMYGQIVIPIFYHVDPSHVRNQTGNFGHSFLKLEERFKGKLQKWKFALKEAANLSGFDSYVIRYEPDLIQKIVEEILKKLKDKFSSEINKLKSIPPNEVQQVLKISYDSLDHTQQQIFLDIACFFNGEDKDLVENFFDACDLHSKIGISVLVDRSLVVISNNEVMMHHLLQKMGREIVRQESVDYPENRSRLWNHEDVYEVLTCNTGTQAIQGIDLNMNRVKEISLNLDTFKQMRNLRFLKFHGMNKFKISDFGSEGYIFRKLRYLHWDGYPLKSLSSIISAENLVFLELPNSNVEQLCDGDQNFIHLKKIDLSFSRQLAKLPNLSNAPNLEKLNLIGTAIEELPSSIVCLSKLDSLCLQHCKSLKSLPSNLFNLKSLRKLDLSYISNLKSLPKISSCNLETLLLEGTAIEELPSSIEFLSRLKVLYLENCSRLNSLPSSLCKLQYLCTLVLTGCSNLQRLPEEIGNLGSLKFLNAERSGITEVPSSIICLRNLEELSFERLRGHEQIGFILRPSDGLSGLQCLSLIDCGITKLPESLFKLSNLAALSLDKNKFERIPENIINLCNLQSFSLNYCERLQSLPNLPSSLESFSLNYCERLQSLPNLPSSLALISAKHCSSLEALSGLSNFFTIGPYYPSFDFENCLKLDQNELKNIVKATAKLKAKLNGASSGLLSLHMCYPGSEIPEFFMFQNMGSSLTLEIPPGVQFNSTYESYVVCLVVSFGDHYESDQNFQLICKWKVKTKSFQSESDITIGCVKSDHVILLCHRLPIAFLSQRGCDFRECCNNNIHGALLEVHLIDSYSKRIDCSGVVKKWGIHFLKAYDFGAAAKDHSRNFSIDEEEGGRGKPPAQLKYSTS